MSHPLSRGGSFFLLKIMKKAKAFRNLSSHTNKTKGLCTMKIILKVNLVLIKA